MSVIGTAYSRGESEMWLSPDARRRHVYIVGQTGTGKTTLLKNLLIQDIEKGHGVGLIDPHGDLAEEILYHIPPDRTDDVAYFNPSDLAYPVGLNPLADVEHDTHHLVVDGIIASLKSIWSDVWGSGQMQYVTNNTLSALLFYRHGTLLGVNRMLTDPRFRRKVIGYVRNPAVRDFWTREFPELISKKHLNVAGPILNKVGQFTTATPMRNILGQTRNAIDIRRIMDTRQIFIANLSKGLIGEENSRLLGSFLVAQFKNAAMSRASIPEGDREDFHLYIDEFQNFTTDSFESILSEARKYRLCLTICHQYLDQLGGGDEALGRRLRSAIFGNVGTTVSFRVGSSDALTLETQFPTLTSRAFLELNQHNAWVKLLYKGEVTDPILTQMQPPIEEGCGRHDFLVRHSRERFGTKRAVVEEKIERWMMREERSSPRRRRTRRG